MRIEYWVSDVYCDVPDCMKRAIGHVGDTKGEAHGSLRRLGWRLGTGRGDLCPVHAALNRGKLSALMNAQKPQSAPKA